LELQGAHPAEASAALITLELVDPRALTLTLPGLQAPPKPPAIPLELEWVRQESDPSVRVEVARFVEQAKLNETSDRSRRVLSPLEISLSGILLPDSVDSEAAAELDLFSGIVASPAIGEMPRLAGEDAARFARRRTLETPSPFLGDAPPLQDRQQSLASPAPSLQSPRPAPQLPSAPAEAQLPVLNLDDSRKRRLEQRVHEATVMRLRKTVDVTSQVKPRWLTVALVVILGAVLGAGATLLLLQLLAP
jgi:hypothetical protein